jgi:hypothetical protein
MRLLCDRYRATLEILSHHEDIEDMSQTVSRMARLATIRNTNVKLAEPPSCSSPSTIVFIGKNQRGQWVAQEQDGLYGGLFVSRAQAVKYALFENGHHPETIVELTREIELDMGAPVIRTANIVRRVAAGRSESVSRRE